MGGGRGGGGGGGGGIKDGFKDTSVDFWFVVLLELIVFDDDGEDEDEFSIEFSLKQQIFTLLHFTHKQQEFDDKQQEFDNKQLEKFDITQHSIKKDNEESDASE